LAPAVRAQKTAHGGPQVPGNTRLSLRNGLTAYSALSPATNSSCHRRQRIDGLSARLGSHNLRQLDTSNGCQDHTALPYAATSGKYFRRTVCDPPGSARSISTSFVYAHVHRSQANPPCNAVSRPTLPRPPHPIPRPWRSRYAPLSGTGPKRYIADLGSWSSNLSENRKLGSVPRERVAELTGWIEPT
jgi:hypothetical protein